MKNELSVPTTIHWHGVEVPNAMDGVPDVTQKAIQTGETFVYEFTAKPAETFMYHPHYEGDVQVMAGLYAPFIIDPKIPEINPPAVDKTLMISEWLLRGGQTYAAMPMSGMEPNYFTSMGNPSLSPKRLRSRKASGFVYALLHSDSLSTSFICMACRSRLLPSTDTPSLKPRN
jgi:FtsP/CotA-like multicopper oxidase with cupredoxin domain